MKGIRTHIHTSLRGWKRSPALHQPHTGVIHGHLGRPRILALSGRCPSMEIPAAHLFHGLSSPFSLSLLLLFLLLLSPLAAAAAPSSSYSYARSVQTQGPSSIPHTRGLYPRCCSCFSPRPSPVLKALLSPSLLPGNTHALMFLWLGHDVALVLYVVGVPDGEDGVRPPETGVLKTGPGYLEEEKERIKGHWSHSREERSSSIREKTRTHVLLLPPPLALMLLLWLCGQERETKEMERAGRKWMDRLLPSSSSSSCRRRCCCYWLAHRPSQQHFGGGRARSCDGGGKGDTILHPRRPRPRRSVPIELGQHTTGH